MGYEPKPHDVSSETSFLTVEDDGDNSYEVPGVPRYEKRPWFRRNRSALLLHTVLISFYIFMSVMLWRSSPKRDGKLLFTPVKDYVQHTVQLIPDSPHDIRASPFVGNPSPELDAAWAHLLRFHNLRITEQEMRMMNITSIAFGRGGGYHGMMAVFHELHCLKLIREATRQDHYYKGVSEAEVASLQGHSDHCIDVLRAGAMCRADTAIFPYHWSDANRVPNPTWVQRHECVDWEKLTEWLEMRRVDIKAPNMLLHPKYGPSYPGGKKIEEPDGPKWHPLDPE